MNICIKPGRLSAASRTALYPATVACDERISIDWARVVLGRSSRLKEVIFLADNSLTSSGLKKGLSAATITWPLFMLSRSFFSGGLILRMISDS
jgi:hypothetical protein